MSSFLWLIPVLPLAGFLVNGLVRLPKAAAAAVGCAGPLAAFGLSVAAWGAVPVEQKVFSWIAAGPLSVPFGLRVDELGAVMTLVVTGVGSLIHVYSVAYMRDDEGFSRFFAYLNLFMFSMLVLVMADSAVLMFLGWEGVGLCSYLLIGFWYKDLKNADAGKKAFITNRVGDFGFLLGIFCLWALFGNLDFEGMASATIPPAVDLGLKSKVSGETLAAAAGLLLFLGATGKSAQIPLYVWLPDAMAGPTPVSALIHAATMVTAGVYMMARMQFLYAFLPGVLEVVGWVAAATALLAGVIAVAQNDIKKILAYSTISQLGFMFAGIAAADFAAGMFHVVTHAFFKALLFLGAGAVIHALHGEQDIRRMGGLGRKLPLLAAVFTVGGLALAGFPMSAGFVSKDHILASAEVHAPGVHALLALTALVTAFYTTRLCVVVFWGRGPREEGHGAPHKLHQPGWLMMGPLVLLAILSAGGGKLLDHRLHAWLTRSEIEEQWRLLSHGTPAQQERAAAYLARHAAEVPRAMVAARPDLNAMADSISKRTAREKAAGKRAMILSSVLFAVGAGSALVLYTRAREWLRRQVEGPWRKLHALVSNKFYVDELYEYLVVAPVRMGATVAWYVVDRLLIDGLLVHGAGKVVYGVGAVLRRPHTGSINAGIAFFLLGAAAMLGYLAWRALR
jgi:NADH-quinone oxidoreductase subunit L